MNNNMRWIPIDCTIPAIGGFLAGVGCAVLADVLPMFHVNWLMSIAMWAAPAIGLGTTVWLYKEGLRQLPFDASSGERPAASEGVDKHV